MDITSPGTNLYIVLTGFVLLIVLYLIISKIISMYSYKAVEPAEKESIQKPEYTQKPEYIKTPESNYDTDHGGKIYIDWPTTDEGKLIIPENTQEPESYNFKIPSCDDVQVEITCPNGTSIKDAKMKYGRWDNSICPHPTVNETTESKFKIYDLPFLNGKSEYSIEPNATKIPGINEDIYYGVSKHRELDYTCS